MATFTLTTTPNTAHIGTEGDDTFIVPSYEAWIASGRTIDGVGGVDTIEFRFRPTALNVGQVVDADFAGVANMESMTWSLPGGGGFLLSTTLAALASLSFAGGLTLRDSAFTLLGSGLTVPVRVTNPLNGVETGAGNDTVTGFVFAASASTGAGDDVVNFTGAIVSPFAGQGLLNGGPGYDILVGLGPRTNNTTWVTATGAGRVSGFEEIWTNNRFDLLAETPTALTGLDGNGLRNPLVLRLAPFESVMQVFASGDGRASYDGRIVAFGGANGDMVRGSSTGDAIDGGSGGADSLSGEGGNDWLALQNVGHLGAAASVAGGAGYDVLALKDAAQTVTDAAFARATGIEELRFLGTGAQSVTLGANSDAAFAASSFGAGSVSAANASSLQVNAAGTSRALSLYGTFGDDTLIGGEGADYIASGARQDVIRAGGAGDHIYFVNAGAFFLPGLNLVPTEVDGGTGYDVLLIDGTFPADFRSFFTASPPTGTPVNGSVRNVEELRLLGTGSQQLSLTLQYLFAGSETGYATITAPNAASLTANLTGFTMGAAVYGTPGNDVFTAGLGRDYLVGGAGADRFNFAPGCSVDVIADFATGSDRIGLSGFPGIADFAAIQARASVVGGNLQIGLSATDAIILAGVTSIAAGDFLFS